MVLSRALISKDSILVDDASQGGNLAYTATI
jgi:hypothetical protein